MSAGATEPRWWGNHIGELRWQLDAARLLAHPVLRGGGVPRGDGRSVLLLPGFLAGDYTAALDASNRAQALLWSLWGPIDVAEHELFSALAHAAVCDSASPDERRRHLDAAAAHLQQLEARAQCCPENFENCAALVAAEIAPPKKRLSSLVVNSTKPMVNSHSFGVMEQSPTPPRF